MHDLKVPCMKGRVFITLKVAIVNDGFKNCFIGPHLISELRTKAGWEVNLSTFDRKWVRTTSKPAPTFSDSDLIHALKTEGVIPCPAVSVPLYDVPTFAMTLHEELEFLRGYGPTVGLINALYDCTRVRAPSWVTPIVHERDYRYPMHLGLPDGEPQVRGRVLTQPFVALPHVHAS